MIESNDSKFLVQSHGLGKYGRLLGEVFIKNYEGTAEGGPFSINQILIQEGHAYIYDGGKKKTFSG